MRAVVVSWVGLVALAGCSLGPQGCSTAGTLDLTAVGYYDAIPTNVNPPYQLSFQPVSAFNASDDAEGVSFHGHLVDDTLVRLEHVTYYVDRDPRFGDRWHYETASTKFSGLFQASRDPTQIASTLRGFVGSIVDGNASVVEDIVNKTLATRYESTRVQMPSIATYSWRADSLSTNLTRLYRTLTATPGLADSQNGIALIFWQDLDAGNWTIRFNVATKTVRGPDTFTLYANAADGVVVGLPAHTREASTSFKERVKSHVSAAGLPPLDVSKASTGSDGLCRG